MAALRDRLGVSARNITVLVDGLEPDGFVRRVPHPTDRRATIIDLTAAGRAAHRNVYATHADRAAALFAAMPATDQRHLTRVLQATARFHHPAHAVEWADPILDADLDAVITLLQRALAAQAQNAAATKVPPAAAG